MLSWIIGLIIGFATSSPSASDTPQQIGAYFNSHRQLAMLQGYLVDGVAGVALIAFVAALRGVFERVDDETGPLPRILFGAGIAAGAVSLLQGLFTQVLADRVAAMGDAGAIRALYDLNTEGDTYKLLALGVFFGAAAILILRTRALPTWLGWVAAVLAPLLIVAGWNFVLGTSTQYAAYAVLLIVLLIWVAAVSVVAWQRRMR